MYARWRWQVAREAAAAQVIGLRSSDDQRLLLGDLPLVLMALGLLRWVPSMNDPGRILGEMQLGGHQGFGSGGGSCFGGVAIVVW